MKPKNAVKTIGAIIVSILLLSSCVAFPPEPVPGTTDSSTAAQSVALPAALPPADNGEYGRRAAEIADGAIRDAIALLEAHPAAEISSGAPASALRGARLRCVACVYHNKRRARKKRKLRPFQKRCDRRRHRRDPINRLALADVHQKRRSLR